MLISDKFIEHSSRWTNLKSRFRWNDVKGEKKTCFVFTLSRVTCHLFPQVVLPTVNMKISTCLGWPLSSSFWSWIYNTCLFSRRRNLIKYFLKRLNRGKKLTNMLRQIFFISTARAIIF